MQELDEVFSSSHNQDVAHALKRIQTKVDADIVKLQQENQVYRATSELPQDLLQAVKAGTLLNESKKSKKKQHSSKVDMSDLGGALDRIQALEEQNEQCYIENQRLLSEISHLKKEVSSREVQKGEAHTQQKRLEQVLRRDQEHSETLVERIRDLEQKQIKDKDQISNLVQVNEELRSLFEQER